MKQLQTFGIICCVLTLALIATTAPLLAEEEEERVLEVGKWYPGMDWNLNLIQSSYSSNWFGSERPTITWSTLFIGRLENQFHERWNWFNRLKMSFGMLYQKEEGNEAWNRAEKTNDEFDFESLLRWMPGSSGWNPYASFRFQTQFLDQYLEEQRDITFNPKIFSEAIGISRTFHETETRFFLGRLGFEARQLSREEFWAPPPDDSTYTSSSQDIGLQLRLDYRAPLFTPSLDWLSRLSFYQPVTSTLDDELIKITDADKSTYGIDSGIADMPTKIKIDWENMFTAKVTKVIAIQLQLRWIYAEYDNSVEPQFNTDGSLANGEAVADAIRKAGQFKQVLSLGLVWSI